MHILLVEDNLMNQKLMVRILTKFGYTSEIANNGQEAVDMYSPDKFDIVLMDIQMPIMDGISATQVILAKHPETIILALTANITDENRNNCLDVGMKEFITKPIAKAELEQTLISYQELI